MWNAYGKYGPDSSHFVLFSKFLFGKLFWKTFLKAICIAADVGGSAHLFFFFNKIYSVYCFSLPWALLNICVTNFSLDLENVIYNPLINMEKEKHSDMLRWEIHKVLENWSSNLFIFFFFVSFGRQRKKHFFFRRKLSLLHEWPNLDSDKSFNYSTQVKSTNKNNNQKFCLLHIN